MLTERDVKAQTFWHISQASEDSHRLMGGQDEQATATVLIALDTNISRQSAEQAKMSVVNGV